MIRRFDYVRAPDKTHFIGADFVKAGVAPGQPFAGLRGQAAQVRRFRVKIQLNRLRQQHRAEHRFVERIPGQMVGRLHRLLLGRGEERFQVDQDGLVPRGDHVFEMEVRGRQGVQERQVAALAPVKLLDLLGRRAGQR